MKKNIIYLILIFSVNSFAQNFGSWSETDSLNIERTGHAMVMLQNGNILVSGNDAIDTTGSNKSCEIFDVTSKIWHKTTSLNKPKDMHHMMLLDNGEVLAFGGLWGRNCEIFNPITEEWRLTDSIPTDRSFGGEAVVKLNDGRVMVIGGTHWSSGNDSETFNKCEIFNPLTEKWSEVTPMIEPREDFAATLLNDGNVLVTGGKDHAKYIKNSEIYLTKTNTWIETTPLIEERSGHKQILLDNNNVLIVGGIARDSFFRVVSSKNCMLYNTKASNIQYVGELTSNRNNHSIFEIADKYLIVIGGDVLDNNSWEVYNTESFASVYFQYFEELQMVNNSNTIQLENNNIFIAGGEEVKYGTGGMPILYLSKRCSIFDIITSILYNKKEQLKYYLCQNYPNPFNPSTIIEYSISLNLNGSLLNIPNSERPYVKVKIYNNLGQEVSTLVNKKQAQGTYSVKFNAKNLSSGIYYYRITANDFVETKKMILLR